MSDQATPAAAVSNRSLRRRRTFSWAVRMGTALFIMITFVVTAHRSYVMWGLPDAPDPFDVKAFQVEQIPDAENAYPAYVDAQRRLLVRFPAFTSSKGARHSPEWADLNEADRAWIEQNMPALLVWQQGTERPRLRIPADRDQFKIDMPMGLQVEGWERAALILASRAEDSGDVKTAWAWHKARLRMKLQTLDRATPLILWNQSFLFHQYIARTQALADHPKMTVAQLREAIADLEAMQSLHVRPADSLKAQYIELNQQLENYVLKHHSDDLSIGNVLRRVVEPVREFYEAEPDRTRRSLRLLYANWLAQAERPRDQKHSEYSKTPLVFTTLPEDNAPISDRALTWHTTNAPIMKLYRSLERGPSSLIPLIDDWPRLVETNRRAIAQLIVTFASRIYELEKGKWPDDPAQLVGTVIQELPAGFDPNPTSSQ